MQSFLSRLDADWHRPSSVSNCCVIHQALSSCFQKVRCRLAFAKQSVRDCCVNRHHSQARCQLPRLFHRDPSWHSRQSLWPLLLILPQFLPPTLHLSRLLCFLSALSHSYKCPANILQQRNSLPCSLHCWYPLCSFLHSVREMQARRPCLRHRLLGTCRWVDSLAFHRAQNQMQTPGRWLGSLASHRVHLQPPHLSATR